MEFGKFSKQLSKNPLFVIFLIFLILIIIKFFLLINFESPWIFADETVYDNTAQRILKGIPYSDLWYCQTYPPGYSALLSIAYLFPVEKATIYTIMLFLNSIVTSSIIFPAYFILKKYIPVTKAIFGSVLISVLPSVILYNFLLMSENLFIPLSIFFIWFLLESLDGQQIKWQILAGITLFLLYLTRSLGIAFIFGLFAALFYYYFDNYRKKTFTKRKIKLCLLVSFFLPFVIWTLSLISWNNDFSSNTGGNYQVGGYYNSFLDAFSTGENLFFFVKLFTNEIIYLILTTYIILFIIFIIFLISLIFKQDTLSCFSLFKEKVSDNKNLPIISVLIYTLVSSLILIISTVVHMYINHTPEYLIFGRYIDPIVPTIMIFGLIGLHYLLIGKYNDKCINSIFVLGIVSFIIILLLLPHSYKLASVLSIYFIFYLQNYYYIVLAFIFFAYLIIPFILLKNKNNYHNYIALLVLVSIVISIPSYQIELFYSKESNNTNQIAEYLEIHSNDSTQILWDFEAYDPVKFFRTRFWISGNLRPGNINSAKRYDYVITDNLLPYTIVFCSNDGYKIYDPSSMQTYSSSEKLPILIDIGNNDSCIVENFFNAENKKIRWTKDSSKVRIEYPKSQRNVTISVKITGWRPKDNPANISFIMNGNGIGTSTYRSGELLFVSQITPAMMDADYQLLEIKTNTFSPVNYGGSDRRNLGVQLDWIALA